MPRLVAMDVRKDDVKVRQNPSTLFRVRDLELHHERPIRAMVVLPYESIALGPASERRLRHVDVAFRDPQRRAVIV